MVEERAAIEHSETTTGDVQKVFWPHRPATPAEKAAIRRAFRSLAARGLLRHGPENSWVLSLKRTQQADPRLRPGQSTSEVFREITERLMSQQPT